MRLTIDMLDQPGTTRRVNGVLATLRIDMTLHRSPAGYFYFVGSDSDITASGVYVYRQSELTLRQWLHEAADQAEVVAKAQLIRRVADAQFQGTIDTVLA